MRRAMRVVLVGVFMLALIPVQPAQARPPVLGAKHRIAYALSVKSVYKEKGCKTVRESVNLYNRVRMKTLRYTQETYFCYFGPTKSGKWKITALTHRTDVWIAPWTLWQFQGNTDEHSWGGLGTEVAGFAQKGFFKACFLTICSRVFPWTQIEVTGRGTANTMSGGVWD